MDTRRLAFHRQALVFTHINNEMRLTGKTMKYESYISPQTKFVLLSCLVVKIYYLSKSDRKNCSGFQQCNPCCFNDQNPHQRNGNLCQLCRYYLKCF
jgi:hypothetical protein